MQTIWARMSFWRWISLLGLSLGLVVFAVGSQPRTAHCQRTYRSSNLVGAHRCRGCHEQAYQTWKKSAHSRSYARLSSRDRKNPACLTCHTTGTASHLQGVQCESCHGGGKYYILPEIMVDRKLARYVGLKVIKGAAGCTTCHKSPSTKLRKFHYPSLWRKIAHGKK